MRLTNFRKALFSILLAVCAVAAAPLALAQAVTGTIVGTITDATGAVISKANVMIELTGQNSIYTTVTNESGNFSEPDLPSGTYRVTVAAPGFKKVVLENITVVTNSTRRVDATLSPGDASELVTVTGAPPELQTDRGDIAAYIGKSQIANLPLSSGNNFQTLLNTIPGLAPVVFNNSQFFNDNNDLSTDADGQASYVNLYQIDGIDDNQHTGDHIILVPAAAAIDNVDITTNNYDAEFGRALGTIVNVTLKSGTNQWHGSAFQNMENNGVNARNFFAAGPNARLVYNYTGGTLGGPVLKDKLFIFGDILRVSDHEEAFSATNIPYYNVSSGVLNLSGYSGQVYDPNTGDVADCKGGPTPNNCGTGRTPFAGNLIPLSNPGVSPVAVTVFQDLDKLARNPNTNLSSASYISGATTNNFSANLPFHKDLWTYDLKADFVISPKDHLSGRFSHQESNIYQAPIFGSFLGGPAGGGFEASGKGTPYSLGFNYNHIFSPSLLAEFRIGVGHNRNSAQESDYGNSDAKTLGIPGNGPNGTNVNLQTSGQVAFQVSNFAGNGENGTSNPLIGYSNSLPWLRAESNIDLVNNWTRIVRNHSVKFGADIRRIRDDLLQGNNNAAAGSFYFSENQTSAPGATSFNGAVTGQANDIASVLFDLPYRVGQDTNSTFPCYRQTWLFFFASDTWQATPKLTLDLGIRYELYPSATPRKAGGFVNYYPTSNNLVIYGLDGNPSNMGVQPGYTNFAPRFGAAYRVTPNLVVRGGFGMSYLPYYDSYAYNYPIKTSTYYTNTPTYGFALNPAGGVVNFVTGIPATPTASFNTAGELAETAANGTIGLANLYIPLQFRAPYVSSWNAAVQEALPFNMSLQLAYVANHGTRLPSAQNINLPSIYGQSASYEPLNIAFGKTAAVTQYFVGNSSNFQSVQAQLIRRIANGLAFTTAFTWGKAQGYVTGTGDGSLLFFSAPLSRNYSVLDYDRKLNWAQTITYELPAGRGHKYFSQGPLMYALGNWNVAAIVQAVSGLPFTVTATSATTGTTQTANLAGSYNVTHQVSRSPVAWFDPTQFAAPATCTAYSTSNPVACAFGNTGRNQFRGPAYFNDNLSLYKIFPVHENVDVQARFDAFNMTNTPAFANPTSALGSNLGKITSTLSSGVGNVNGVGGPRVLQASIKVIF